MELRTQTPQQNIIPAEVTMPVATPEHTATTAPALHGAGDMISPVPTTASATARETVDSTMEDAFVPHSNTLGSVLENGESTPGFNVADTESPEPPHMGGYRDDAHLRKAYRLTAPIIGRAIRR